MRLTPTSPPDPSGEVRTLRTGADTRCPHRFAELDPSSCDFTQKCGQITDPPPAQRRATSKLTKLARATHFLPGPFNGEKKFKELVFFLLLFFLGSDPSSKLTNLPPEGPPEISGGGSLACPHSCVKRQLDPPNSANRRGQRVSAPVRSVRTAAAPRIARDLPQTVS